MTDTDDTCHCPSDHAAVSLQQRNAAQLNGHDEHEHPVGVSFAVPWCLLRHADGTIVGEALNHGDSMTCTSAKIRQ